MPLAREIAENCAEEGLLQIEQKGKPVDPKSYKGPIRLRLIAAPVTKETQKK